MGNVAGDVFGLFEVVCADFLSTHFDGGIVPTFSFKRQTQGLKARSVQVETLVTALLNVETEEFGSLLLGAFQEGADVFIGALQEASPSTFGSLFRIIVSFDASTTVPPAEETADGNETSVFPRSFALVGCFVFFLVITALCVCGGTNALPVRSPSSKPISVPNALPVRSPSSKPISVPTVPLKTSSGTQRKSAVSVGDIIVGRNESDILGASSRLGIFSLEGKSEATQPLQAVVPNVEDTRHFDTSSHKTSFVASGSPSCFAEQPSSENLTDNPLSLHHGPTQPESMLGSVAQSPGEHDEVQGHALERSCLGTDEISSNDFPPTLGAATHEVTRGIVDNTAATADASIRSKQSRVSFGNVSVREHERCVDSNIYMGLSLGWGFVDLSSGALTKSPPQRSSPSAQSRRSKRGGDSRHACQKHNGERYSIFLVYGLTRKELKQEAAAAAKLWGQKQKEVIAQEERELTLERKCKREAKMCAIEALVKRKASSFSVISVPRLRTEKSELVVGVPGALQPRDEYLI